MSFGSWCPSWRMSTRLLEQKLTRTFLWVVVPTNMTDPSHALIVL